MSVLLLKISGPTRNSYPTRVILPMLYCLIIVDLQKKAELEGEIADLTSQMEAIGVKGRAKGKEETDLRNELDGRIKEEFVSPKNSKLIQDAIGKRKTAWDKTIREQDAAQTRLETKKAELRKEEKIPDTSERDLAKVEEKRANAAGDREEIVTRLTVCSL